MQMAEESILEFKNCKGEISSKGLTLGFEFRLLCARDGRISIFLDTYPCLTRVSSFWTWKARGLG